MRSHVGEITNNKGNPIATMSTLLNGITPLIEINGNIIGLDLNKFTEHVIKHFEEYIKEFKKGETNGKQLKSKD